MERFFITQPAALLVGPGGEIIVTIAIGVIFVCIAWKDFRTKRIPNQAVLALLAAVLFGCFIGGGRTFMDRVAGALCVSLPMLLLTLAVPGAFGGGDIKLMAVCGLWLGWKDCLTAMWIAIVAGGLWAAFLLLTGKRGRKSQMAFGPFLITGVTCAWLWGEALREWYMGGVWF